MTAPTPAEAASDAYAKFLRQCAGDITYVIHRKGRFDLTVDVHRASHGSSTYWRFTGWSWRSVDAAARRALLKLYRAEEGMLTELAQELRLARQGPDHMNVYPTGRTFDAVQSPGEPV